MTEAQNIADYGDGILFCMWEMSIQYLVLGFESTAPITIRPGLLHKHKTC